ncbi:non-ribosomal peptide synthetase [Amycolatopsis pithecellobii]|uniref:Amino acid adenylation domain-containing protein n=1 Tax=Amycolatopsis pithecellobii TaxID=664692 RepID=A0A6N7Z2W4_9PSEU|nr:non-ribosomal peptide synthetase [Amycolatopsis pithecellobii]MTD54461.1 amino acid adenylation domain-containing protein [Amycolatopsis pithecellobii]
MWTDRIAIIGMSLRFPGADTPEGFWADISAGTSRVHHFTDTELAHAGVGAEERGTFVAASGLLTGVDHFDAEFFGMSAREAAITDPQHRLFLECCYHALEDGGYPDAGARVGVYASTGYRLHSLHSYLANNLDVGPGSEWIAAKQAQVGNYTDYAATQVAYRLGLTGPAITVSTACSSSLVAIHLACQGLLSGDAELALAGSSALHFPQVTGHRHVKGSTMSPTGMLRAFDAAADGTVAGNGVAAVLLKRLDRALADGDTVHAVVLGSGVTNDGAAKTGFAAPSAAGQRDAVLRAVEAAGVPVTSIGYLEAHGTGTRKGDPIEFDGLTSAYRRHTGEIGFCALGTTKPRIGHLDSCAGMAGLITAVLAVRHGIIPPLVNFTRPNPALALATSPFTLASHAREWPVSGPRRAGVHAVGMGGTNAHVIVEQAPARAARTPGAVPGLLPLSARDPAALTEYASAVYDFLRKHPATEPADLVTTLALGRRRFAHRLGVPGHTVAEWTRALGAYLAGETPLRAGDDPDWTVLLRDSGGGRIPLPHYPFRRTRHWAGPPPLDLTEDDTTEAAMPDQDTLGPVIEVTARHLGYEPGGIDPDRSFVDLGADSLQLISVQVELESAFGLEITMAELLEAARSPKLLAELIAQRRTPPPPEVHGPRVTITDSGTTTGHDHVTDLTNRLTERTRSSKKDTQRHRAVLADSRAVVGFRAATKEMRYLLQARSAHGAHLTDVDGHDYVDITMGFGALLFGHEPEFVTEAVRRHLADGLRFGLRSADTGEAAALLAELTGMERVAFAATGTEANSAALRLARAATGRTRVVVFRGSYHGHLDSVLGRAGGGRTVPVSAGIPDSAVAELIVLEYGDPQSLETIEGQAGTIAAVLVEPVQCRNPSLRPKEFVRSLRELTRKHGIVLIFDEMLTGLRPHPGGAQQHYGVQADLATYGKALGSGFPIGAIAGRADVMDYVDGGFWRYGDESGPHRETVFFGGTHLQHPVSMAAARAVLTHLKQEGPALQAAVNARTGRLADELNRFFTDEEFPLRLDHFGSMFRFTHRADLELLYHHLLLRGVHVWEWRSFYLSTAHTDADVAYVADAVRDSLRELRAAGFFPAIRPRPRPVPVERARPAPEFSIYFFGDSDGSTSDKYRLVLDTARFADEHGFHALWLPERHFHSFGGLFPNPSVLAAALTQRTSRIRLNAGSVVLPLHDPIRVAEEWSIVDNLSDGRVGLGFGTGWHSEDFALHPDRFDRRRDIAFDHFAELKRLWRGEPVRRRSGTGAEIEVRALPYPVQQEPPMWLATTGRVESYVDAGRLGLGVLTNLMHQTVEDLAENIGHYRAARQAAGLDPDGGRVTVLLHTYLADEHAIARADALEPMIRYLRSSLLMRSAAAGVTADDLSAASPADLDTLFRRAYDRYCDQRALIGTPETCTGLVAKLDAAGVDEIAALVDFGLSAEQVSASLERLDRLRRKVSGPTPERSGPATAAQRRIWLACQFTGAAAYNEIQAVRLRGKLDEQALHAAVRGLVERHPGLRMVFRQDDGDHELRQFEVDGIDVPLQVSDHHGEEAETAIAAVVHEESRRAYDLTHGPLCTPRLLRLGTDDHAFVLGIHHLITDGHSAGLIAADLQELYRASVAGRAPRFDAPGGSPLDAPEPKADPAHLDWWRRHLGAEPPMPRQPTDRPRDGAMQGKGASVTAWFTADQTAALRRWCSDQGATLHAGLLTAWRVVLRRFSGQDEFVVGTTFGRRGEETGATVGFFVSLLPLRGRLTDEMGIGDAVREARDTVLAASAHLDVDPEALGASPGQPLVPVSVDLDTEALPAMELPGLRAEPIGTGAESAPLELSLAAVRSGTGLRLTIRYDAGLYDEATARRYLDHLQLVLDAMAAGTDRIGDLPPCTPGDEEQLRALSGGKPPSPGRRTLDDIRPAGDVIDETGRHTGTAILAAANGIAARLTELGARRGDVVAIVLPRGHELAAAILGTVAAGAAYLPLDPSQPLPRLSTMVANAQPVALIGAPDLRLAPEVPRIQMPKEGPLRTVSVAAEDLLCLLYTSGSTGSPKGVLLEHGNVAATLAVFLAEMRLTADDRLSWYSAPGFDAGNLELWPALLTGAELHVVPDEVRLDPQALVTWLVRQRITVAFLPTAVGEAVLDQPWPPDAALRVLCVGGERLHARPRADLPFTVHNIYGPTECSIFCCWNKVSPEGSGDPSLGAPNPGLVFEVRDAAGRLLPPGAIGELHVGGPQVARGYHRDTTDRRFRTDTAGRRWYRTGDLVRWRTDGELDFAGRVDDQVQIRGVRVEPAEVTRAVRTLPGVRDARVLPRVDEASGRELLVCQVLADRDTDETELVRRWRAALAELLPRPMVPERWQVVDELPLSGNGKWDRHASTPVAGTIRELWAEVLGVDGFADDARFFDLGGHSLTVVALLNRIRERLAAEYTFTEFFADPTVRGMATRLGARERGEL